jgi:hypothetical protein
MDCEAHTGVEKGRRRLVRFRNMRGVRDVVTRQLWAQRCNCEVGTTRRVIILFVLPEGTSMAEDTLVLLQVAPGGIVFGCVPAHDLGGNCASLLVYADIRDRDLTRVPQKGELVLGRHVHTSVYRPHAVVDRSHLCVRQIGSLPGDVLYEHFPLFEHISVPARRRRTGSVKRSRMAVG